MSKRRFTTTRFAAAVGSQGRRPSWKVYIWNPNRTTINDVVLGQAESPRYDITPHVKRIDYHENIVHENNDDAVASNAVLTVVRDPDALPIEITERTLLDGAPIRIIVGDDRFPESEWVPILTGVIRGVPTSDEFVRGQRPSEMSILVVDRAESMLNRKVTARSYERGTDTGKVAIELAIEFLGLDRREIDLHFQDYEIAHTQAQVVDIEVLSGIAQVLFPTRKKPRFNAFGKLVAADTDFDRPPARRYDSLDHIVRMARIEQGNSLYNEVKLYGIDDEMTRVVERETRLAHGQITSGWFESRVHHNVWFSEDIGKPEGGRRAIETWMKKKVSSFGAFNGQSADWTPFLESDGETTFGGQVEFDTGFAPEVAGMILGTYAALAATAAGLFIAEATTAAGIVQLAADLVLVGGIISMQSMGRVEFEIFGKPAQNVYQQLLSVAFLSGIPASDVKTLRIDNQWLYDIDYMDDLSKELLRRELSKRHTYEIEMLDDPLLEVDDIIELKMQDDTVRRFYVASIDRAIVADSPAESCFMTITGWRIA